ncbi:two-component system, sensor histidine kinase [Azospirillaceae bacterium]
MENPAATTTLFWAVLAVVTGGAGLGVVGLALRFRALRQALRQAQDRGNTVLETAVDSIITIDDRGTILSANRATERIFGYRIDEMVGHRVNMLMPAPDCYQHDQYLERYHRTGERRIIGIGREVVGRRKDGGLFAMELAVGEATVDGARIFTGIVRDISERKKTEEELRESEERFRLLVDNIPDFAMTWLDLDGRVASWNPGAEKMYGWRAGEIIGQSLDVLYPPEARSEPVRAIVQVRISGRSESEGPQRCRNGMLIWVHAIITPLRDGSGTMRGFVRVARDMTERRRSEQALLSAKEQAERASLAQSKFLAAASHDLRQPVQALLLFSSALEAKITGTPASALLRDMRGSLDALNMLLDSLLDVSRLDAGIVIPRETNFSLTTVIERLAGEYAPQAADKGIRFQVVPSSAVVRTDPTLLYRILQNFLSNSLRYTSQGRIVVGCRRRGGKLRIEVVDTGIGIPNHQFEDIFKEFYQLGNPERDRTKGLGLGLAIVRRLSRLLHCPVTVRSQEGRGSSFGVEVPLIGFNKTTNVVYLRPEPLKALPSGKGVVFVIDDEPSVLKGLRLVIEDWGYAVITARTELEAITKLTGRSAGPDLIIADYRLRGICNGAQVVAQLREIFNRPIPGILITGDTAPDRIREATEHGLRLLHKPIQPAELCAAIVDCLSGPVTGSNGGGDCSIKYLSILCNHLN